MRAVLAVWFLLALLAGITAGCAPVERHGGRDPLLRRPVELAPALSPPLQTEPGNGWWNLR